MKKKFLSIALGVILTAVGSSTYAADKTPVNRTKLSPNEKAIKNFKKEFKDATTPVIYAGNDGFILKSIADGHNVTSAYDKKGNWVYTIKLYPSENLAKDIIDVVKDGYDSKGYFITMMEKVDQPGDKSVYVVHMQNNNEYKTLRVSNNEVELVHEFQKA